MDRSGRLVQPGRREVPGEGNVIAQNRGNGIHIGNIGTYLGQPGTLPSIGNVVQGNLIGTDVSGTIPLGNTNYAGVSVAEGAMSTLIGGSDPAARMSSPPT